MDFFRFEDAAIGELLAAAEDRNTSTTSTTQPSSPKTKDSSPSAVAGVVRQHDPPNPPKSKWRCPRCQKSFTRGFALRAHLRTHDNSKPFACTVCQMSFTRDHDRKMHESLHSGSKQFVCGEKHFGEPKGCGRSFSRASNLKRHLATCKGEPWVKPVTKPVFSKSSRGSEVRRRRSTSPGSSAMNPISIEDGAEGSETTLETSRSREPMTTVHSHEATTPRLLLLPPPTPTPSPPLPQNEDGPDSLTAKLAALEEKLKLYEKFWREKGFDVQAEAEGQDRDNASFSTDAALGSRSNRHSDASSTSSVTRTDSDSQTSDLALSKTSSSSSADNSMLMDGRSKIERIFRSNAQNPLVRSISNQTQDTSSLHACPLCPLEFDSIPSLRKHIFIHAVTHAIPSFRRESQDITPWARDPGTSTVYCVANPRFGVGCFWGCGGQFENLEALRRHFASEQGHRCLQPVFNTESTILQRCSHLDRRVFQIMTRQETPLLPLVFLQNCSELSEEAGRVPWVF